MADTFFGFESSLNHDDHLLASDDVDCLETEEEEYDALNDETFGTIDDVSNDDWEQQHEQFAEFAESKKQSDKLENTLTQLVLDDNEDAKVPFWPSFNLPNNKNGINHNDAWLKRFVHEVNGGIKSNFPPLGNQSQNAPLSPNNVQIPRKICTVEELERGLLKSRSQGTKLGGNVNQQQQQQPFMFQQCPPGPTRLPPGLQHPAQMRPMNSMYPMPNVPMNCRLPPFLQQNHLVGGPQHPPAPPGLIFPPPQFPMNHHPFNFPPPPRPPNFQHQQQQLPPMSQQQQHQQLQHQQQQQQMMRNNHHQQQRANSRQRQEMDSGNRDEYSGLMTSRDKQWLLNIQLLQLNTGTPYFDDYYYTVFKERKARTEKDPEALMEKNQRHNRQQKNGRQENANPLQPRVYTPLQFENSLGKLQCGSVTAPRKIIDMDVVTVEKDSESGNAPTRDTKKIKQLLLELEAFYSLMLRAEDLNNPTAIKNLENLRQLKQKQRLREIDAAPTPEQKQEILKLLQQESIPIVENEHDYFARIVTGLLQDDKFASFMNIRKGKMLLLRLLPHLTADNFHTQLLELWTKILLSVPVTGRRDTFGDYLLPKFHPFYKRFIQSCKMSDILDIACSLIETVKPENSRATPLSHQGRAPLHFVTSNKFGVSALATTLVRSEYLISSGNASEKQVEDWSNFLVNWADTSAGLNNVAAPIELVPLQIFAKHCVRIAGMNAERKGALQKHFVDTN